MPIISPAIPTDIAERLLAVDTSDEMALAVASNCFYVEASPCLAGYSIGSMDDNLPCLYATKDAAESDRKEMVEEYLSQIEQGERDDEDEWESEVMKARFNPLDNTKIDLLDESGDVFHTESIKSLCGF